MFPHSLGLLYSAFTAFLGFRGRRGRIQSHGHGALWPAALCGQSVEADPQNQTVRFSLDMDYFCFQHSSTDIQSADFVELFGEPRPPNMLFFTEAIRLSHIFRRPASNYLELCS